MGRTVDNPATWSWFNQRYDEFWIIFSNVKKLRSIQILHSVHIKRQNRNQPCYKSVSFATISSAKRKRKKRLHIAHRQIIMDGTIRVHSFTISSLSLSLSLSLPLHPWLLSLLLCAEVISNVYIGTTSHTTSSVHQRTMQHTQLFATQHNHNNNRIGA